METEPTIDDVAANGSNSQSVRISANYHEYTPPFPVEPIIRRMLDSVPQKYLNGLSAVVLANSAGLPRKLRRSVTKSRKRKVRIVEARGLYHPAWHGCKAWIEIFVDNTLLPMEGTSWWYRIAFYREGLLAKVLFHEIGHHIHATSHPEYREKEDVADLWKVRLWRRYVRRRHPWIRALLFPLRPLMSVLGKALGKRLVERGSISRAEYDERRKKYLPLD